MKIINLLARESIEIQQNVNSKEEALKMAVGLLGTTGKLKAAERYLEEVLYREQEGSTGIGGGIALPHAGGRWVKDAGISILSVKEGVEFEAMDKMPVYLIFLIAIPDKGDNLYLGLISRLAMLLMDKEVITRLRSADTPDEMIEYISQAEQEAE